MFCLTNRNILYIIKEYPTKKEKTEMEDNNSGRVNCFHCRHFVITWEPKHPKACSFYEFKSSELPSLTVFKSTGTHCMAFERKEK